MIDRRTAITTGLLALTGTFAARAQQAARPRRIGFLSPGNDADSPYVAAFRASLAEFGQIEGRDIALDIRTGAWDRLPGIARELVADGVVVIVADSNTAGNAARQASSTLPIVVVTGGDPVALGWAKSLGRPGGNVTGIASLVSDLGPKRLELLVASVPNARRIVVLYRAAQTLAEVALQDAAGKLGVTLETIQAENSEELRMALGSARLAAADGVLVWSDPLFTRHRDLIAARLAAIGRPAIYGEREHVEAGGLMSYGPDMMQMFRRLAVQVDRILRGASPDTLPFEQVSSIGLVINLKTANALGLAIPQSLVVRADEVIE